MTDTYTADDRWKDYLKKFLIITVGGALASRAIRAVAKKVKEEVQGVDVNQLINDPKAEAKRLGEKWKKESEEGIATLKGDAARARKRGLAGIVSDEVDRIRSSAQDVLCSLVEERYPFPAELIVDGIDARIGEYGGARVTREQADLVRSFYRRLSQDTQALPLDLGYGEENADVRREILTAFVGLATTDPSKVLERLEVAVTKNFFEDPDPTLRRKTLDAMKLYADRIGGKDDE